MGNKEASNAVRISSEDDMVSVRSKIEASAKSGNSVFIESGASPSQMSQLREYAAVVGADVSKIVEVSSHEKTLASRVAIPEKQVVTPERDPFGTIDGFAPESSFKPNRDWDSVQPAKKLANNGRESSGIVGRLDGRETYESQREVGVRPGEASIASPNAIQEYAESKDQSSLDRIRESNDKRREKIVFDKKQWEEDFAKALPDKGTIAMGGPKLTGASVENSRMRVGEGQHSMFDVKDRVGDIPEMTAGEMLSHSNDERRESIQRPKNEDRSWDAPKSSKKEVIGDVFFEALKRQMGSLGKQ
jgi:hypothetical protein